MTRKCLICDAPTTQMQLGIDVCRACAVFYRRANRLKCNLRCKDTRQCSQEGRVLECRRCRYDAMQEIIDRANVDILPTLLVSESERAGQRPEGQRRRRRRKQPMAQIGCLNCGPSTSATPVLDRIRSAYDMMTRIRKSAELCMRPVNKFVHPTQANANTFSFIKGTHGLTFRTTQILISSLFDFASIAFPDFDTLTQDEKWHLIKGCYDRVSVIESTYRASKIFPDDGQVFCSYTMTLSLESVDHFFSDCPQNENSEEAKEAMRRNLSATVRPSKAAFKRTDPTDEEFLVLIALSLWNTDIPSGDDRLSRMANASRTAVLKDLHAYYAARGVSDYATRIGELFCLLVTNEQVTSRILEDCELYRVMGIYKDPLRFDASNNATSSNANIIDS